MKKISLSILCAIFLSACLPESTPQVTVTPEATVTLTATSTSTATVEPTETPTPKPVVETVSEDRSGRRRACLPG
ncbi:MAG: hypothetical protein HND47_18750 [Chloroflexi bacterium]|nr:hypothetical protein [Chloroflexota bacterium]